MELFEWIKEQQKMTESASRLLQGELRRME